MDKTPKTYVFKRKIRAIQFNKLGDGSPVMPNNAGYPSGSFSLLTRGPNGEYPLYIPIKKGDYVVFHDNGDFIYHTVVKKDDFEIGEINAREKLDEYAEMQGWNKNKLIGWSEAADFAEWLKTLETISLFTIKQ